MIKAVSLPVLKPGFCLSYFRPCFQLPMASSRISHSAATSHSAHGSLFQAGFSFQADIYTPEADCRWVRRGPWPFWAGRMLSEVWRTCVLTRRDLHPPLPDRRCFLTQNCEYGRFNYFSGNCIKKFIQINIDINEADISTLGQ